jgi:hypothetical protein
MPIPEESFPHINDKEQAQEDFLALIIKGVVRRLQIFGVFGALVVLMVYGVCSEVTLDLYGGMP